MVPNEQNEKESVLRTMHCLWQKRLCLLALGFVLMSFVGDVWAAKKVVMSDADLVLAFGVVACAPGVLLSAALCYFNGVLVSSTKAPWKARLGQVTFVLTWFLTMPVPAWVWFDIARGSLKGATTSALIITTPCVLVSVLTSFVAWRLRQHQASSLGSVKAR